MLMKTKDATLIPTKLDNTKFVLDDKVVKEAWIHPKLVKKRPESQLNIPGLTQS
jgi:hypothetical protein